MHMETAGLAHNYAIYEIGDINLQESFRTFIQDCRTYAKFKIPQYLKNDNL